MKTLLKIVGYGFLILFALLLFIGIGSMFGDNSSDQAQAETTTEETNPINETVDLEALKAELEKDKTTLEKVKKSFTFKEDEFTGGGWYKHKLWDANKIWDKKVLTANVNKNGFAYLVSNFHNDDWIFHESITVKIGDDIITSEEIPSYDENNVRDNSSGSIWETLHFTGNRDNGIFEAIATNPEKTIKVRFNGRQYHKDITVSKNDKQAMADCYRLSQLITSIKEKEAALASTE